VPIRIKRVFDPPAGDDGVRILVDRLWPRGLTKDAAKLDHWMKSLAPSNELRHWFKSATGNWSQFKKRYFDELAEQAATVQELAEMAAAGNVTLLYAKKDERQNNAVALREYLETKIRGTRRPSKNRPTK